MTTKDGRQDARKERGVRNIASPGNPAPRRDPNSIPLQEAYTGSRASQAQVISPERASESCASLGMGKLLKALNELSPLTPDYTLSTKGLATLLGRYIDWGSDFGTAYGELRPHWANGRRFPDLPNELEKSRQHDREERKFALQSNMVKQNLPPRRVWDLYSNRVISFHKIRPHSRRILAVSHSWVSAHKRSPTYTPINGCRWQVPVPAGVKLDLVRNELLNHGAEYAWLDVLCLQQEDSSRPDSEPSRVSDWQVDVPTIGHIYHMAADTLIYFNGLGLPLKLDPAGKYEHRHHWLNRAWTLQEARHNPWIGGLTADIRPHVVATRLETFKKEPQSAGIQLWDKVTECIESAERIPCVFAVVEQMNRRKASHSIDKVVALAQILNFKLPKPAYIIDGDIEDMWIRLVNGMDDRYRADLFVLYPTVGSWKGKRTLAWMPSWADVCSLTPSIIEDVIPDSNAGIQRRNGGYITVLQDGRYHFNGLVMERCKIKESRKVIVEMPAGRRNIQRDIDISIIDDEGASHTIRVQVHHEYGIPESTKYRWTLLGTEDFRYWVVGQTDMGKFTKTTVLRIQPDNVRKIQRLKVVKTGSLELV